MRGTRAQVLLQASSRRLQLLPVTNCVRTAASLPGQSQVCVCFSHFGMETSRKSFALFKTVKFCFSKNMNERCGPEQSSGHLIQVTY